MEHNKTTKTYNKFIIIGIIILILSVIVNIILYYLVEQYEPIHLWFNLFLTIIPSMLIICYGFNNIEKNNKIMDFDMLDFISYFVISILIAFLIIGYKNHDLIPFYTIGIIALLILIPKLANNVIHNNKTKIYQLIFDFIATLAMTIFLIYSIPSNLDNLQNIVTSITAAIYGGFITLTGVKITIINNNKHQIDKQTQLAKPYFDLINHDIPQYTNIKQVYDKKNLKKIYYTIPNYTKEHLDTEDLFTLVKIKPINFEYVGEKICMFRGITFDDNLIIPYYNVLIHKGDVINLTINSILYIKDINSVKLIVDDICNNSYALDLPFTKSIILHDGNSFKIHGHTQYVEYTIRSIQSIGLPVPIDLTKYKPLKLYKNQERATDILDGETTQTIDWTLKE